MNSEFYLDLCSQFKIRDKKEELESILSCYDIKAKSKKIDLNSSIEAFLLVKKSEGLSSITIANYRTTLTKFNEYINGSEISKNSIRDYIISLNLKQTSVNQYLQRLKVFFCWLYSEDYVSENYTLGLSYKIPKTYKHAITEEDIAKIKKSCTKEQDKLLVELLLKTGCRVSEICNIKARDIDFNENSIRVTGKGNKIRVVLFDSKTKKLIRSQIKNNEYLFHSNKAPYNKVNRFTIEKRLRVIGQKAKLNYSLHPHLFRHTFATECLEKGLDLISIKTLLGHADLSSTQVYAESSLSNIKKQYRNIFK